MIETHTIRLRGPWECEIDGRELARVHMPAAYSDILGDQPVDRLTLRRRFGCPTCLDPHESVWLAVARPALSGVAYLNGDWLGPIPAGEALVEYLVTARLRERNELVLELGAGGAGEASQREAGLSGDRLISPTALLFAEVRLEIRG